MTYLYCPGPINAINKTMDEMESRDTLNIKSGDPGFYDEVHFISNRKGFTVEKVYKSKGIVTAKIKKS